MVYKDIDNKGFEKKIKSTLRGIKINSALKNMIIEIFLRRAYELELTSEQFEDELNRFKSNIKSIDFKNKSEFPNETTMGLCDYTNKAITINRDYFAKLLYSGISIEEVTQKVFGTLTHEVNHAAAPGLRFFKDNIWYGSALDEVVTETIANRNCLSKDAYVAQHYRAETDGYGDITFASNIIAASFGMSEKEFLKVANSGRENLIEKIRQSSCNPDRSENYFQAIEQNLNLLYNVNYKTEEFDYVSAIDIRKQALVGIYCYSLAELSNRFEEEPIKYNTEAYYTSSNYKYNRDKIKVIMRDTIDKYTEIGLITPDSKDFIIEQATLIDNSLQEKISDTTEVAKYSYAFDKDSYDFAYEAAKSGNIRQYADWYKNYIPEFGRRLSMKVNLEDMTDDLEYSNFILREDYDEGKQWNNFHVLNKSTKAINKDLTTKSIYARDTDKTETLDMYQTMDATKPLSILGRGINSVKNFFSRLKNRNLALPPSNEQDNKIIGFAKEEPKYIEPEDKLSQYMIEGKALYDPELRNSRGATKEAYRKGTMEQSTNKEDEER